MQNFSFVMPESLEEASRILVEHNGGGKIVAGSTDIAVTLRHKKIAPFLLVSLSKITGLNYVKGDEKQGVRIGATTTMAQVAKSKLINDLYPALASAARQVGSPIVRNRATLGGNLCNASPAADSAPPLLIYEAKVKIFNGGKARETPLSEFFEGPGKTVMQTGDILTEIILPPADPDVKSIFYKQGKRKALEISMLTVAVNLTTGWDGTIKKAVLALGAVGPTPIVAKASAKQLIGKKITGEADLEQVLETLGSEISPISDIRSSADYRRHMARVMTKRCVLELLQ